jgi:hypothetical protein
MSIQHEPIPGRYYINLTGQMIKVKALLYYDGLLSKIIIEYLDGNIIYVAANEWGWLDLSIYNEWRGSSRIKRDLEKEI